jgi:arsenate reductase
MWTVIRRIAQALPFAILGALIGVAVGGVLGYGAGCLLGRTAGAFAVGALLGGVMGAFTGTLMSDESGNSRFTSGLRSTVSGLWSLLGRCPCWREGRSTPKGANREPQAKEKVPTAAIDQVSAPRKPVVLFLCTRNSARSQMAEALLKRYAGDQFEVYSAGLNPKGVHPLATKVMSEAGIDISGYQSKGLRQFLGNLPVSVAITVCASVEEDCPTHWPGAHSRLLWPFDDPVAFPGTEEERLAKFRVVRDQVDQQIKHWLRETCGNTPPDWN